MQNFDIWESSKIKGNSHTTWVGLQIKLGLQINVSAEHVKKVLVMKLMSLIPYEYKKQQLAL